MNPEETLTQEERNQMFRFLHRYATTELDQWDLSKFNTKYGYVYITISRGSNGCDGEFTDVTHLIEPE